MHLRRTRLRLKYQWFSQFQSNTTTDWRNHQAKPFRSCVTWKRKKNILENETRNVLNPLPHNAALWRTKDNTAVENIVRKGEIACNKQFLFFSQCFLPYMTLIFHFKCTLKCRRQFFSIWTNLKFCRLVMGYKWFGKTDPGSEFQEYLCTWAKRHIQSDG